MQKMKNSRGITLIALVITITVLLILAGITIGSITNDNGVVNQANEAKILTDLRTVEEAYNVNIIQRERDENVDLAEIDFLTKIYIGEENYIYAINNVEDIDVTTDFGKGTIRSEISNITDLNDVYFVDEDGSVAYVKDGTVYGEVELGKEVRPTREDLFVFDEETGTITGIVENTSKDPNGIGFYYDDIGIISHENIIIPSQINGVEVKQIGDFAFIDCGNLKSVVIPDTVVSIGKYAFESCIGLISIDIPDSVTKIGERAFENCEELQNVVLSKGLTSIEWQTFEDCKKLKNINIPDGVTNIGYGAFRRCESLEQILLPDSLVTVGGSVFYGCSKLETVVLSKNLTEIGYRDISKLYEFI